jgi:TonB-dependent receptor
MNNMYKTATVLAFLAISDLSAQTLKGAVLDAKTGESIPGAVVVVEGTGKAAATDFDGRFVINGIPEGEHQVIVNYISYTSKRFQKVNFKKAATVDLNVALETAEGTELQEVVISTTLDRQNNNALALQQKNAASVSDGIAAETIRRTPDRSSGDVLRRVSGASIQDNKFAIIRGLSDRYNTAYINGAPLPSSESDRKAFAFDIFPALMLDNLIVVKSATPDMPADFAGGMIEVNTKSIPESRFTSVSVGGSYHTLTTMKPFKTYDGGKYDWAGLDDGSRALPGAIPATAEYEQLSADEKAEMAKHITPSWKIKEKNALPGGALQVITGDKHRIGKTDAGFIFAYNYQSSFQRNDNIRREFEESESGVVQRAELRDEVFTEGVLNSALLNAAVKVNDNHQFSLRNIYSINSSDKVTIRNGVREMDNDPHQYERSSNRWFTQNRLFTSQLQGDHYFEKSGIRAKWTGGASMVDNDIPNMRRIVYQKQVSPGASDAEEFVAVVQNNGTIPTAAGNMFWANTHEKIYSMRYEASLPVKFLSSGNNIKIGGMQQLRDRNFSARSLGFSRYRKSTKPSAPFDNSLLTLPEDELFAPEHLGMQENGLGGFKLEEATKVHDSYRAGSTLHAGFAMFDSRIMGNWRVIGGARLESYNQVFTYTELGSNLDRRIDTTVTDLLPSLSLVYALTEKSNLRAAVYRTVSRPEFRELAPFQFYNFAADNILSGSPTLKRALITNADLRYEIFPGYGQLFSVSAFYKHFQDPIELIMRSGTSGAPELTYTNVPSAVNYGMELEYRLKLQFLTSNDSTGILANTTLFSNVALIRSDVDLSHINGSTKRPLQGQSPFLVNAGLMYNHPDNTWQLSVAYNLGGRRVYIAGNTQEPDVWENHRHVVDFQVARSFGKLVVKLNVKDLLAQDLLFYQNVNSANKYESGKDNRWQETTFGRTISLSAAYTF